MLAHQPPQIARANGIDICYEIFGDPAADDNAEPSGVLLKITPRADAPRL